MDPNKHLTKRLLVGVASFLVVASFAQAAIPRAKAQGKHARHRHAAKPNPREPKGIRAPKGKGTSSHLNGGPDAFGYRFIDQNEPAITFNFVEIRATGTNIVSGDDVASAPVTLGAPFSFYGTSVATLVMATNGYLTTDVTDTGADLSNDCPLPAPPSSGGGGRMYPLHDDLVTGAGYTQFFSPCPRVNELGTAAEPCTVFEWDDTNHFGSTATFEMETILYHTTGVILHQIGPGNSDQGAQSTTGQQDPTATIGLTYACNTPGSVVDNTAVAFYVCDVILAPPTLPNGQVGVGYAQLITASGAVPPYLFSVTAGSLPPGLGLSAVGDLIGIPTQAGTYNFTVTATDPYGCTGSQAYTIVIACGTLNVLPPALANGTTGTPYNALITATGGTAPYTFAVTAGALPTGLALAAGGLLSGTPTTAGTFNFTITATDAGACVGTRAYTLIINQGLILVDYVLGDGLGQPNANRVRVFNGNQVATATDFLAYGAGQFGVNVASGNIDATSFGEIITGPGPGPVYGPQVRAFDRTGTPINKVNFFAYGTLKYGVNVASGEIDGDAFDEIFSGAGPGAVFGPHVRGWNYDGTALTAIAKISFFAYGTLKYGVNVDEGNVDTDAFTELVTGPGPGPIFGSQVRGWNYDGASLSSISKINFNAYALTGYGVNVSGGDVDNDGFAEIVTAPGPGPTHPSRFIGYDYDNNTIVALVNFDITGFPTLFGGRLGLGDVDTTGNWELLAGAGLDPTADSTVKTYTYVGTTVSTVGVPFAPFGTDKFGVNLAGGYLGF